MTKSVIHATIKKTINRFGRRAVVFIPESLLMQHEKDEAISRISDMFRAALRDALNGHTPQPIAIPGVGLLAEDQHLSEQDREQFWQQGVNLDDWDYLVIVEPNSIWSNQERDVPWQLRGMESSDMLLHGCSHNRWYRNILWRGKRHDIGVAYHS